MGIGFVVTIILLAILLGVFSRQVLTTSEDAFRSEHEPANDDEHKDKPHFNAM